MTETTTGNTVRLHRVLRAPADRVYRAFLEPSATCKWLPPYGYTAQSHHSDIRVGGGFRMSFTSFATGHSEAFGGTYLELIPHERIRYTDQFEDRNLPGEILVTMTLRPVASGTELVIVQENIPAQIPADMCYLGWQQSLSQLANLVEPEAP